MSGFSSFTAPGINHSITVAAKDQAGNIAAGYRGTVHFSSTDSAAILPADYAFTEADAGVHSFFASLSTAGTHSIIATDSEHLVVGIAHGNCRPRQPGDSHSDRGSA